MMENKLSDEVIESIRGMLGWPGAMISGSKSGYRRLFPDDRVVFNSNVATNGNGKVWYGDLNITQSAGKLYDLVDLLGEDVYVFYEMDMRFGNESKSVSEVVGGDYPPNYYKVTKTHIEHINWKKEMIIIDERK